MSRYIVNRFLTALLIVWGVLTLSFLLMHLAPGEPTKLYLNPEISPLVLEKIRRQMGLDQPVWMQYLLWLKEFVSGNFGFSFFHQRPVGAILLETIPNTLRLTLTVFILQFMIGIPLGVVSALKINTKSDQAIQFTLLFFYAMPGFWLTLILMMIFSLKLGWLPSGQMQSLVEINGFWANLWDYLRHLILPAVVLSMPFIAMTSRFVRANLSEILHQPYIQAAHTYGLSRSKIIYKYALKNALLPLITLIGLYLPFLLGGAVITEYIFAWPGMGRVTVEAIFTHDYPLILATTFVAALAVVTGNFISDILYRIADPRIKPGT